MSMADHLQAPRHHGLFKHHGIDLGDGTVAHYLEGKEILRSSIQDFCANQFCTKISYQNASPKYLTLKRAISRIGEQKYNLLFNNCEHFARWCKTGKHRSIQVENFFNNTNIALLSMKQLLPNSFITTINFLLRKDLIDHTSKQKAKEIMNHLKQFKKNLTYTLDSILEEIGDINHVSKQKNEASKYNPISKTLLLKGQEIADQLNTIESIEAQITKLLSKTNLET